jgi:nickel superoxide dismutase
MRIRSLVQRVWPVHPVLAHCDIPCGIYDPVSAKIAAQTVLKMVMRIEALESPDPSASAESIATYVNTISRYVAVKEEHAQLAKKELDILWHDYFRPDHLEEHPDLHTTFWNAAKLAGQNKQSVNREAAQQLVNAVDSIAQTFWSTKGVTYSDAVATARFGT